jgi:hypothetical protein
MLRRAFDHPIVASRSAAVTALAVAALLVAAAGADARIGVSPNFRLGTDLLPARGKDAVSLAVNPRNPRHIVEVNADWMTGECEYHVSFNGGRTWRGGDLREPAGFNPLACTVGPHLAEHMQSGAVAFGSRGNVYAAWSSPRFLPGGNEEGKSLLVSRSRNGGRTWSRAVVVAPGGANDEDGPHHILPTLNVDPARRGGPAQDVVYVAAGESQEVRAGESTENLRMVVSRDAGRTWTAPFNVNAPDENAIEQSQPVIGRGGHVYVAYRVRGRGQQPGSFTPEGFVTVAKSTDRGRTWSRVRTARVQGYVRPGPAQPPFPANAQFTASTFPRLAADRRTDDVYVVFGQGPGPAPTLPRSTRARKADHFIHPDIDVYFQRSADGGASWSPPKQVNTSPQVNFEVTQARHPWVNVAPNGRVDVVWQDRRHWYRGCVHTHVACTEARLGDTYYAYSTNRGTTFTRNYRISDRSTNNDVGFDYRFGTYWAYAPVAVSTGRNRLLIGWMDSRLGDVDDDSQDIALSRVTVRPGRTIPTFRIRRAAAPRFSVRLSRLAYPGGPEAVLAATFATRPWTRLVIVNERDVSGALAGGVLARANLGPVLASPGAALPSVVRAEVRRLRPIGAFVVGGESQLSPAVVDGLAAAGVPRDQIVRLAGADAADTARRIAEAADRRTPQQRADGQKAFDAAIVTNPASPDALTAAVLAANRRLPILYVDEDTVPQATAEALRSFAIDTTLVVGGPDDVSDAVAGQLPNPRRLGGRTAGRTSRLVVRESVLRGVPDNVLYTTNGRRPMETALLGASVARLGGLQHFASSSRAAARGIGRWPLLRERVTQLRSIGR